MKIKVTRKVILENVEVAGGGSCLVNVTELKQYNAPDVLMLMLGVQPEGKSYTWGEPERNEEGQLVFCKNLGITRDQLISAIAFLRTGFVLTTDAALLKVFTILGGCEAFEDYIRRKHNRELQYGNQYTDHLHSGGTDAEMDKMHPKSG